MPNKNLPTAVKREMIDAAGTVCIPAGTYHEVHDTFAAQVVELTLKRLGRAPSSATRLATMFTGSAHDRLRRIVAMEDRS